jgi:hypothetical protein
LPRTKKKKKVNNLDNDNDDDDYIIPTPYAVSTSLSKELSNNNNSIRRRSKELNNSSSTVIVIGNTGSAGSTGTAPHSNHRYVSIAIVPYFKGDNRFYILIVPYNCNIEHYIFALFLLSTTGKFEKNPSNEHIYLVNSAVSRFFSTMLCLSLYRNVTKPRDVKNKSNRTKMILKMNSSPTNSKSPSPPILITSTDKFVQQSGSVYCSLFGDDLMISDDEDGQSSYA